MRVKEIDRTANIAWSPAAQHPTYIAAGTAAQQLDATFSTSAALEIYKLDLAEGGLEMDMVGTIPSDFRFHVLRWGSFGMSDDKPSGVLCAGADNGNVFVWDAAKLLEKEDPLIYKLDKHTGAVAALDINPFQENLLASGGSESEIFIWDLNNPTSPMTPGAKSQPPDDVTCIGWNRQVQHIMASTYAGRCVVWDLRKNEPIIKVSDSMARIKCKLVAWHPEVATQMCLASEDDHTPVIQLWDLRFATSPLKVLESHQRGILSMAWCPQDPDLLLSCGKDNRILCWNPNTQLQTGEVVYELPTSNQWSFDVQWCPRNPAMISSCSFDGHVSVYSLMGGAPPPKTPSKIADSFPTDPFSQPMPQQPAQEAAPVVLKKPPKWLRRPVGASFSFGGKLVTFEADKPAHPQQPPTRQVNISQVVTETDLITRSNQLESALNNGQLAEFCALKISNSKSDVEESIWNFLQVHFEADPRQRYLQLLGYEQGEIANKVAAYTQSASDESNDDAPAVNGEAEDTSDLTEQMSSLNAGGDENQEASAFDQIAQTQKSVEEEDKTLPFATGDDCEGLVTKALLMANFEAAVEVCLHNERMAEAIILAIAGGPELLRQTQNKFFQKEKGGLNRLISSVVTRNHEHIMKTCDLENWREALALSLTYAKPEEFTGLCDILGSRLEIEQDGALATSACLCYICAGNVDKLVQCWSRINHNNNTPLAIQDLVEKVSLLRRAVETSGQSQLTAGSLAEKLSSYADMLAAQGSLNTAVGYLANSNEPSLAVLRDRLLGALGQPMAQKPFQVWNVQPEGAVKPAPAQPVAAQQHPTQRQRTNSGYYQANAGNFQTTTTPTSSYYTPSYSNAGAYVPTSTTGSAASAPYYPTPSQPVMPASSAAAPGVVAKGPLAHKYGPTSYPAATSSYDAYGNTPYSNYGGYDTAAPTSQPSANPQPAIFDPTAAAQNTPGAPFAPAPPAGAAAPHTGPQHPPMSSWQESKPERAWNDPPLITRKRQTSESSFDSPAAITAPIMGMPQDQNPPGAPSYGGGQYYNPQQYQPQPQQPAQPVAPEPEPPKPKAPIPSENQVLVDVFDNLTNQCMTKASNPQTKRKLEDVLRKLETLYDKLRSQALSPNVIMGLHQIIQAIQQYDYQTGLAYHTNMISQGNFSEISSFMPGIKILMQTAGHLQCYYGQ